MKFLLRCRYRLERRRWRKMRNYIVPDIRRRKKKTYFIKGLSWLLAAECLTAAWVYAEEAEALAGKLVSVHREVHFERKIGEDGPGDISRTFGFSLRMKEGEVSIYRTERNTDARWEEYSLEEGQD